MIEIVTDKNGCENLIYNGIVFEDFVVGDYGLWSQICDSCISEHQIDGAFLDDVGSGLCGVKGCDNESDNYIDFPHHTESEAK
jgi:hypothetical protein